MKRGKYIGITNLKGEKIHEGDIVQISSRGFDFKAVVLSNQDLDPYDEESKKWDHMLYSPYWEECEILGSIYDKEN